MDHSVHAAVQADEQAELGDIADGAFDLRAGWMGVGECNPGIFLDLFQAKRNSPLLWIDLKHLDFNLLAGRNNLAGMDIFLGPAHFRDVDQAFDTRLKLNESAIVGDVRYPALDPGIDRIFSLYAFPGVVL